MSSTIYFRGQLLLTIHKGHGYYAGVPWVGNARRRPAVRIRLGQGELCTKRWEGVGEASWNEIFRFVVNNDGSDVLSFVITLLFDEQEVPVSMFTIELATVLSHVGPQWHQFRTPHDDDRALAPSTHNIRSEALIEARWFPEGTPLPPNFLRSLSASADTGRPKSPSASPTNSSAQPSASNFSSAPATTYVVSVTSNSLSVPGSSPSQSPVPHSPPSHSSRHSRSGSLPVSLSNPSLSTLASNEQTLRALLIQHTPNLQVDQLSLFSASPTSAHTSTAHLSLSTAPFVYSGNLHGRLHPDSRSFDDRNFLEHLAAVSSIVELLVWGDHSIQSIQLVFSVAGSRIPGIRHGTAAVSPAMMSLADGEYITALGGKRDDVGVKALTVVTNRGQRRQFGAVTEVGVEMGEDLVCQAPRGARVVCLMGDLNGKGINAIGICWQNMNGTQQHGATLAVPGEQARAALVKQSTSRHI